MIEYLRSTPALVILIFGYVAFVTLWLFLRDVSWRTRVKVAIFIVLFAVVQLGFEAARHAAIAAH